MTQPDPVTARLRDVADTLALCDYVEEAEPVRKAAGIIESQQARIAALEAGLLEIAAYKLGGLPKPGQIKNEHRAIISLARTLLSESKTNG